MSYERDALVEAVAEQARYEARLASLQNTTAHQRREAAYGDAAGCAGGDK